MRALHAVSLSAFFVVSLAACGQGTSSGGGSAPVTPPAPVPAPPATDGALLTSVGLDDMGYHLPAMPSCLVRADEGVPPTLASGAFKTDGDISEWTGVASLLADSLSDAPAGGDIAVASVAESGDDLALMVGAALGPNVSLGIEIGDGYLRRGSLGGDILVHLRVHAGALERQVAGAWQAVGPELGALGTSGNNYELRLSRALIGEALTYPAWSVRIFTTDEASGVTLDTTNTAYFGSWLNPDKPQLTFTTCKEWYTQHVPIELAEVREATAPNPAFDQISDLARLAIDMAAQSFHGENPPVMKLPVVETHGGGDGLAFASPFAAPVIDLDPFDPASVDPFPEGPAYRQIADRIVDLYLLSLYPQAEPSLRRAVNQALVDHMIRDAFGSSYFFDSYRSTLVTKDQNVAYGHVLGGVMSSDQLVDAWKALAGGGTADAVFAKFTTVTPATALAAVGDSDLDGLPDNYEAVYGTNPKLADSDGDSWSDLAEVINSEDPLQQTRQPNRIMPDGIFDDWLTMFPQKVRVDEGHSDACPVAADIDYYAALASRDVLMIGAVAKDFWENDPHASWEAVIDMPNAKRQFLVSVPSDSYKTVVKDPDSGKVLLVIERAFPQGRKTVEWVFRARDLKVDAFDAPDAVRVRIRTLFHDDQAGKDNYCDETAWFAPYVTR